LSDGGHFWCVLKKKQPSSKHTKVGRQKTKTHTVVPLQRDPTDFREKTCFVDILGDVSALSSNICPLKDHVVFLLLSKSQLKIAHNTQVMVVLTWAQFSEKRLQQATNFVAFHPKTNE